MRLSTLWDLSNFLHRVPDVRMRYISVAGASENGGSLVKSAQGFTLKTEIVESLPPGSILLIPGGIGTRSLVMNNLFLQNLAKLVQQSQTCLTVCTGAALLAATGVLDGKPATTNKRAFEWVRGTRPQVGWRQKARWVSTEKFYTSSGVSAGMDMTLGFIADRWGLETAQEIASRCEYLWQNDPDTDPFAHSAEFESA